MLFEETNNTENSNEETKNTVGLLLKRKDYLGVDEVASYHPNRTYYYKKNNKDLEEIIENCTKQLQVIKHNSKFFFQL
jgi:hypothetical protein